MIFNALLTALTVRRSQEQKLVFETGQPSPYKFSNTSRLRHRQSKTNFF